MTRPTPTYVEELSAWVRESASPRPRQDKNLAAFLAVKANVEDGLRAGYPAKTIWAHLCATERIKCRYETFLNHVRQQITEKLHTLPEAGAPAPAPTPAPETGPLRTDASVPGFTYRAAPDKKDLIG